jgi:hypothetical protein
MKKHDPLASILQMMILAAASGKRRNFERSPALMKQCQLAIGSDESF